MKTRASRRRSGRSGRRKPTATVVLELPGGSRIETPNLSGGGNKVSEVEEGFAVEVDLLALIERFALERRSRKPGSDEAQVELDRLWRRGLRSRARLRRALRRAHSVWTRAELEQIVAQAMDVGIVLERLVWKFGGVGGETAKSVWTRLRPNEGLTRANVSREAHLGEGLKHKLGLLCTGQPNVSRSAIARWLLEEDELATSRCHNCQRVEWAVANRETPPCARCERGQSGRPCRRCEECVDWYGHLARWRDRARSKVRVGVQPKGTIDERIHDALRKRIDGIDPGRRGVEEAERV